MGPSEKNEKKCISIYSTQAIEESTNNCRTYIIFLFGIIIVILCEQIVVLTLSDEEKINFSKYITIVTGFLSTSGYSAYSWKLFF